MNILRQLRNGLDSDVDSGLLAKANQLTLLGDDLTSTGMLKIQEMIRQDLIRPDTSALPAIFEEWHGRRRLLLTRIRNLADLKPDGASFMKSVLRTGLERVLLEGTELLVEALRSAGYVAPLSHPGDARELVKAYEEFVSHTNNSAAAAVPRAEGRNHSKTQNEHEMRTGRRGSDCLTQSERDELKRYKGRKTWLKVEEQLQDTEHRISERTLRDAFNGRPVSAKSRQIIRALLDAERKNRKDRQLSSTPAP